MSPLSGVHSDSQNNSIHTVNTACIHIHNSMMA